MPNVSTTQELAKRLEKLEARKSRAAQLEQEVAGLKLMATQLAKAGPGTKQASANSSP